MKLEITKSKLYRRILDEQNIYSAIFCLESYVFDKGLLNTDIPVTILDEHGRVTDILAHNDLELYYALSDKYNVVLIDKVIELCKERLTWLFSDQENIFTIRVFFKLKSYDEDKLKFRPLHTSRLIDLICMVSILIQLMYDDDYQNGKRYLSDLSKLLPHNFYGNIPSTNVQYLFHKWQNKYKEYTENVIEHCRTYQNNHNYLTEVCLDIKNFFPSISPKLLYDYIVEKLSSTYKNDLTMLKMAVTKLLFFNVEEENIKPWKDNYYYEGYETPVNNFYMNCGIPQGLPQSYFFGNLCMIEVKNLLMRDESFKGDSYFYVDDSVIYVQAELTHNEFEKKIGKLNIDLCEWCKKSDERDSDIDTYVPKDYLDFHKSLKYQINFHENDKSMFTPIDVVDNQLGPIANLVREVSLSSNLSWTLDEIDDQVSLEKLMALDKVITTEIENLKKKEKGELIYERQNIISSRLKLLRRFKKFFLYRKRLLKIREVGGPNEEIINDFKDRLLSKKKSLSDWFEQNEEDIFQSEYRLIIQSEPQIRAEKLGTEIKNFELSLLKKAGIDDISKHDSLFFNKDVKSSVYMKNLGQDSYRYLRCWAKANLSGFKNLDISTQMINFQRFLTAELKGDYFNIYNIQENGFEKRKYTSFVMKSSKEFQRKILNVYFSEVIGILPSDSLVFTKLNCRKFYYTELRLLIRLRNKDFDLQDFTLFVKQIKEKDVSNRMVIDMGLIDVLSKFVVYVRSPQWVDDLILTHRITKGLWYNGSKFLNSYTLHNEEHAVTLINKSIELTNRIDYFVLKDVDYYILFLACYLHDISMVIHPDLCQLSSSTRKNLALISDIMDKMKVEVDHFSEIDVEDKKNSRMKKAGNFLVNVFNKVYEYFENEVRSNHPSDSAKFIRENSKSLFSYLQPTLLSFVAKVSESHGYDVLDVYGLKSRAKSDTISLKYLMMLIRLADLMDVANDRVNYYLLRQNLAHLSSTSKFHWISHLVTDKVELVTKYEVRDFRHIDVSEKPITEIININLYINFQQLTTAKQKNKCKNCSCTMGDHCITIDVLGNTMHTKECSQTACTVLCCWMMKKNEWLINELSALCEYLFSVNNSMFQSLIKFNIIYHDDMKLDPDMFDCVQDYLGV